MNVIEGSIEGAIESVFEDAVGASAIASAVDSASAVLNGTIKSLLGLSVYYKLIIPNVITTVNVLCCTGGWGGGLGWG